MTTSKVKTNTKTPTEQSTDPSAEKPADFEQAFAELERIVVQMESVQMPLGASLAAYQRGNTLLQFCQKSLADVEQQVQILNTRNQLLQFKSQED